MLQGQGVVLESRVEVGQREMTGVARLGGQAEVRQAEAPDEEGFLAEARPGGPPGESGVGGHKPGEDKEAEHEEPEDPGPARHVNRCP
jgi:hypothetical protein